MTETTDTAPEAIPTTEADLYSFVTGTPYQERWTVADRLREQTGHDHTALVDRVLDEVSNSEAIDAARTALAGALTDAHTALKRAVDIHAELTGPLFDVEYAEGSELFAHHLNQADIALRTTIAVNPTSGA